MQQNRWRLGLRPRPHWESSQRSPNPLAKFKGLTLKPVLLKEVEGRGNVCPRAPEPLALPLIVRGRAGAPRTLVCGDPQFEVTPLIITGIPADSRDLYYSVRSFSYVK